jgi:hypothetical protein
VPYSPPLPPRVTSLHTVILHAAQLLVVVMYSSFFSCCRTRASLWPCRVAGPSAAVLAKLPPCTASLPSVQVCLEPPRFSSIRAPPRHQRRALPRLQQDRDYQSTRFFPHHLHFLLYVVKGISNLNTRERRTIWTEFQPCKVNLTHTLGTSNDDSEATVCLSFQVVDQGHHK